MGFSAASGDLSWTRSSQADASYSQGRQANTVGQARAQQNCCFYLDKIKNPLVFEAPACISSCGFNYQTTNILTQYFNFMGATPDGFGDFVHVLLQLPTRS